MVDIFVSAGQIGMWANYVRGRGIPDPARSRSPHGSANGPKQFCCLQKFQINTGCLIRAEDVNLGIRERSKFTGFLGRGLSEFNWKKSSPPHAGPGPGIPQILTRPLHESLTKNSE